MAALPSDADVDVDRKGSGKLLWYPEDWGKNTQPPERVNKLADPHIKSFDWLVEKGLNAIVSELDPVEVESDIAGNDLKIWFESPELRAPMTSSKGSSIQSKLRNQGELYSRTEIREFPKDCRVGASTYAGDMFVEVMIQLAGGEPRRFRKYLGKMPIMVKSKLCHLRNLTQKSLIHLGEEPYEFGGYFICNGNERIVRLILMQRRNYVMAVRRDAFKKRGKGFTDYGVYMRCCRSDMSAVTVRLFYLESGEINFSFSVNRQEYIMPLGIIMKALWAKSDKLLFEGICSAAIDENKLFYATRAESMLASLGEHGLRTQRDCVEYLGKKFRVLLEAPKSKSDIEVGLTLIKRFFFVHCSNMKEKSSILIFMIQKLMALVCGTCQEDNPDCLAHHEVLLPGHIMANVLRDQFESLLKNFKYSIEADLMNRPDKVDLKDDNYIHDRMDRFLKKSVGARMEYFLNTGNLVSKNIEISQTSGFTIVAEKLNYFRYLSHFRAIHRGAYYATLQTTKVRKLLPESWGFMCPVHTPDGAPCGLLNHMTAECNVRTSVPDDPKGEFHTLVKLLVQLGMNAASSELSAPSIQEYVPILLDGHLVGHIKGAFAGVFVSQIRKRKCKALELQQKKGSAVNHEYDDEVLLKLDPTIEVAYVPFRRQEKYPGIYLFTHSARMSRAVFLVDEKQNASGSVERYIYGREFIGTLEQMYLDIHCPDKYAPMNDMKKLLSSTDSSHIEISPTSMLSIVASLTPWSDFNQSPRNMYQCQMAKQTMGTPLLSYPYRFDNKLYRLNTPQTPIALTKAYDQYQIDEYAAGTNAIVAVLSYTGYDMEDAMILNKASMERGFAHGTMYKSHVIEVEKGTNLGVQKLRGQPVLKQPKPPCNGFGDQFPRMVPKGGLLENIDDECEEGQNLVPSNEHDYKDMLRLDHDGLPHLGATIWPGDNQYSVINNITGRALSHTLKGEEVGVVDQVALISNDSKRIDKVNLKLRYNRNPVIGDKFASRHGQKGILSYLYNDTDMPWCELTGMRPDIIFNPHGFPSRMTIGMLIESIASKSGALNGEFKDATPFAAASGDDTDLVQSFGEELLNCGFHKNGTEKLISGITGEELEAEIYVGVVYYQRLRHMVSDKFQVRSTGPINNQTRQPVKGRKVGGGIRFGEMERDALIAHGVSYICYDRLHLSSDYYIAEVCCKCGQLLATTRKAKGAPHSSMPAQAIKQETQCLICKSSIAVRSIAVPYVFKYLITELASVNIKCVLDIARFGTRGGIQHV